MKIIYSGSNEKLSRAVRGAGKVLEDQDFYNAIRQKVSFKFSKRAANEIAGFIEHHDTPVNLKLYSPAPFRHRYTNAYVSPNYSNIILFNAKKIDTNSVESMVNTIVHEYVHCVDFFSDGNKFIEYGHGSQSASGKSDTAPYWIGNLAESIYIQKFQSDVPLEIESQKHAKGFMARPKGTFSGEPLTRWKGPRNMMLEEQFSYTDPNGRLWNAPATRLINGASIPKALWSILGGPYSGSYRKASVVHDVAVGELEKDLPDYPPRKEADRMFYHACRDDGCSRTFSLILYTGVRLGSWNAKLFGRDLSSDQGLDEIPLTDTTEADFIRRKFYDLIGESEPIINDDQRSNYSSLVSSDDSDLDAIDAIIDSSFS